MKLKIKRNENEIIRENDTVIIYEIKEFLFIVLVNKESRNVKESVEWRFSESA